MNTLNLRSIQINEYSNKLINKIQMRLVIIYIALLVWYHFTKPSSYFARIAREKLNIKDNSIMSSVMSYLLLLLPLMIFVEDKDSFYELLNKYLPQMLLAISAGITWYHLTKPGSIITKPITNKINTNEESIKSSVVSYLFYSTPFILISLYGLTSLRKQLLTL